MFWIRYQIIKLYMAVYWKFHLKRLNEQTVKKMSASKSHITLVSVLITLINI